MSGSDLREREGRVGLGLQYKHSQDLEERPALPFSCQHQPSRKRGWYFVYSTVDMAGGEYIHYPTQFPIACSLEKGIPYKRGAGNWSGRKGGREFIPRSSFPSGKEKIDKVKTLVRFTIRRGLWVGDRGSSKAVLKYHLKVIIYLIVTALVMHTGSYASTTVVTC